MSDSAAQTVTRRTTILDFMDHVVLQKNYLEVNPGTPSLNSADQIKLLFVHSSIFWLCTYLFGEESVSPDELCKSFKPAQKGKEGGGRKSGGGGGGGGGGEEREEGRRGRRGEGGEGEGREQGGRMGGRRGGRREREGGRGERARGGKRSSRIGRTRREKERECKVCILLSPTPPSLPSPSPPCLGSESHHCWMVFSSTLPLSSSQLNMRWDCLQLASSWLTTMVCASWICSKQSTKRWPSS